MPSQADVDKVTWLFANKYYPTKDYTNFTPVEKVCVHQSHNKDTQASPQRKVVLVSKGKGREKSDDDRDLFDASNDKTITKSSCSNAGNLAFASKKSRN